MKLNFKSLIMMLLGVSMASACNSLEVTMPVGPRGEQGVQGLPGKDGMSAYELWVKAVKEKLIDYSGPVDLTHFFLYLKGRDGIDGKDGKDGRDGIDGKDGRDGKSAYELWKEYVASGVDDPHNPGKQWDRSHTSMVDFYWFLTGNNGADGLIPYIKDGNWWVGDKDTGVRAKGDKGDKGDDGNDGLSAYEMWKEYVRETIEAGGRVQDQNGNEITLEDLSIQKFFQYLTGKAGAKGNSGLDGRDGKDGKDGKDGSDGSSGSNGKSAYELWVLDVTSPVGLEDPKNPGVKWDSSRTSLSDFYEYLRGAAGADGKNGKDGSDGKDGANGKDGSNGRSAYELWKEIVLSDNGLDNPGNGVYDIETYPKWPRTAVTEKDFYEYLKGRDGEDGKNAPKMASVDTMYVEEADWTKYNVAPVRALAKVASGGRSAVKDTTYEYVNPYTGGASLVVTGPGPVLLAGCEVTFKDQAGNSYTKTSDALGYIYLDKDELPVWSEESPGAGDLSRRTRPERFRVGDKEITDPSLIAATCAVPYRVGVTVEMTDSEWRESTVDVKYDIARVVEGKTETSWSGIEYPHCDINSGQGYFFYRSVGDIARLGKLMTDVYGAPRMAGDHFLELGSDNVKSFWIRPVGTEASKTTQSVSFGDGVAPSKLDIHYLPVVRRSNGMYYESHTPDYGMEVVSESKTIIPEYCLIGSLDIKGKKGGEGDEAYTSHNNKLVLSDDGAAKVPVNRTNYELILGQTSFSFAFDYSTFGHVYRRNSYYDEETKTFRFTRYDTMIDYLKATDETWSDMCVTTFENSGNLNDVKIRNTVKVILSVKDGVIQNPDEIFLIRNVYDGFDITFSNFMFRDVYYGGKSGKFRYSESTPYRADCTLGDENLVFQAIKDARSACLDD